MPLVALNSEGRRVTIFDILSGKESKDIYYCPFCKSKMHVVMSTKRIPHFRHAPNTACGLGSESERHLRMKAIVGMWLMSKGWDVDFEVKMGSRVADIVAEKDFKMTVEVQHSPITFEEVLLRVVKDKKQGYKSLWFFDNLNRFYKLVNILIKKGYMAYILNIDDTPPTVGRYILMDLSPSEVINNFVALKPDSGVVTTSFCPRCYYIGEFVKVHDYDMVNMKKLEEIEICPRCSFEKRAGVVGYEHIGGKNI